MRCVVATCGPKPARARAHEIPVFPYSVDRSNIREFEAFSCSAITCRLLYAHVRCGIYHQGSSAVYVCSHLTLVLPTPCAVVHIRYCHAVTTPAWGIMDFTQDCRRWPNTCDLGAVYATRVHAAVRLPCSQPLSACCSSRSRKHRQQGRKESSCPASLSPSAAHVFVEVIHYAVHCFHFFCVWQSVHQHVGFAAMCSHRVVSGS